MRMDIRWDTMHQDTSSPPRVGMVFIHADRHFGKLILKSIVEVWIMMLLVLVKAAKKLSSTVKVT